jgi:hypothetical protein
MCDIFSRQISMQQFFVEKTENYRIKKKQLLCNNYSRYRCLILSREIFSLGTIIHKGNFSQNYLWTRITLVNGQNGFRVQ